MFFGRGFEKNSINYWKERAWGVFKNIRVRGTCVWERFLIIDSGVREEYLRALYCEQWLEPRWWKGGAMTSVHRTKRTVYTCLTNNDVCVLFMCVSTRRYEWWLQPGQNTRNATCVLCQAQRRVTHICKYTLKEMCVYGRSPVVDTSLTVHARANQGPPRGLQSTLCVH